MQQTAGAGAGETFCNEARPGRILSIVKKMRAVRSKNCMAKREVYFSKC